MRCMYIDITKTPWVMASRKEYEMGMPGIIKMKNVPDTVSDNLAINIFYAQSKNSIDISKSQDWYIVMHSNHNNHKY